MGLDKFGTQRIRILLLCLAVGALCRCTLPRLSLLRFRLLKPLLLSLRLLEGLLPLSTVYCVTFSTIETGGYRSMDQVRLVVQKKIGLDCRQSHPCKERVVSQVILPTNHIDVSPDHAFP